LHRSVLIALAVLAVAGAPAARAADPILPLSEVEPGISCTGLSVLHGTAISSFDVQVLDVIAANPTASGARLLVRVSGPAVDGTGVGPGFSGSPIYCGGRNAGAISEGIGEYGNTVVLATPIEAILGARPRTSTARVAPRLLARARPLAAPLTVSGASPHVLALLQRVAKRAGRPLLDAPPGPLGGYPVQNLVPGSAVAASLSTGDLAFGAVGTVAYRDGNQIFAFGHALDGAGPRALFLQDAYVFGVIGNPIGVPDFGAMTYKLTSGGGHNVGELTNDTFSAIAGTLGADPPSIPLRATARLAGGSNRVTLSSGVADERSLGYGGSLAIVAPTAAGSALDRLLDSLEPVAIQLCTRFRVRERKRPIGFCNAYFDAAGALTDVARAGALVDEFDAAPLHIRGAAVGMSIRRGFADDVLVSADAPARVHPGERAAVKLRVRRRGSAAERTLRIGVPIPGSMRPGVRTLVLKGTGFESGEDDLADTLLEALVGEDGSSGGGSAAPRSVRQLAAAVAAVHRPIGIAARFRHREPRVVLESDDVRYDGQVRLSLRVVRAPR
jgi:hypothetical protein